MKRDPLVIADALRRRAEPAPSPARARATPAVRCGQALLALGLVARVLPFFEGSGRFLERFPTEDGYLMLTVARNLALGHGLSTADGTIPTNGVQPLMTLVWAALFGLAGGDKALGVALVLLAQLAIAGAAALALHRLARELLAGRPGERETAWLAAGAWFGSPVHVPHTMNCLETGAYALVAIQVARLFLGPAGDPRQRFGPRRTLGAGLLLGLAFWIRNDAVFLIAAACLTHAFRHARAGREVLRTRLAEAVAIGLVALALAVPWLLYNQLEFGHVVPVSGRTESSTAMHGWSGPGIPPALLELCLVLVPIPHAVEGSRPVILGACAALLAMGATVLALQRRWRPNERGLLVLAAWFAAGLCLFYGLFFGAAWFLPRYLFPLSPFLTLGACAAATAAARGPFAQHHRLRPLLATAAVLLAVGVSARNHVRHRDHMHFQVVRWSESHVEPSVWLGAIQTGTLGFFHDRTINFDGKVNPLALRAVLEGRRPEYVVATPVEFLVDWSGIVDWLREPSIAASFEVVVEDRERNLGVLRRRAH